MAARRLPYRDCKGIMNGEVSSHEIFIIRTNGAWTRGTVVDVRSEHGTFVPQEQLIGSDYLFTVAFAHATDPTKQASKTLWKSTVGFVPDALFKSLMSLAPVQGYFTDADIARIYG